MARVYHTFYVNDIPLIKQQMLNWANRFSICCFLNNNEYKSAYNSFECLTAVGLLKIFREENNFFESLTSFINSTDDWIFGHFNYDIKNKFEETFSANSDNANFSDCFLFVPEIVLQLKEHSLIIAVTEKDDANTIYSEIIEQLASNISICTNDVNIKPKISRNEYLNVVSKLQKHINRGDCYVINFCQEFFATVNIEPVSIYTQLNTISPNPFSAYYRVNDNYLMCASPERYIKKEGDKIISQPIKGTSARNHTDTKTDYRNKIELFESTKDRSENVMVVDLVRNDISKVCEEGSVVVDELFGIYSFPTVHQMISTVSGKLKPNIGLTDVLKATFPMGSMTGAPKKKVMDLTEKYESSKRGIYSGAVGYISPGKNFDFNVVIRSLVYNKATSYLSFFTGSAITSYSKPENEYDECLLKGEAIMRVFSGKL